MLSADCLNPAQNVTEASFVLEGKCFESKLHRKLFSQETKFKQFRYKFYQGLFDQLAHLKTISTDLFFLL